MMAVWTETNLDWWSGLEEEQLSDWTNWEHLTVL